MLTLRWMNFIKCQVDRIVNSSGNTIGAKKVIVDKTVDATFSFDPVDIHNNGAVVLLQDKILEAGWSRAANVVTYTGTPDKVRGYVSLNAEDAGASNYWSRPQLNILRGGNIIAVVDDIVMQNNGAYDGDATLNGVFFDKNPGVNPSYTFEWFDDDNRTATLVPNSFSQLALEATTKVQVYSPV